MLERPTGRSNGAAASKQDARQPKLKHPGRAERDARLADALRANLKKRKAQAQTRTQDLPDDSIQSDPKSRA